MKLNETIQKLRTDAKMSQEAFAELFDVSKQAVQKWETGENKPNIEKLILISKRFDISLDALIFGSGNRQTEAMHCSAQIVPQYDDIPDGEFYPSNLEQEYKQCVEEGLDIERYESLFQSVATLPKGEIKKEFGDILQKIVFNSPMKADYPYTEPSDLTEIRSLRKSYRLEKSVDKSGLQSKIEGAWTGRICGCLLGKTIEGIRLNELIPFLQETDNYPLHRYIYRSDVTEEICKKYSYPFYHRAYADKIDGMPADDDTNYTVLAQIVVDRHGRDFTSADIARAWTELQGKNSYFTAERVAYCNLMKGYTPPASAKHKNPFREWIGAQIRGDYFGYINPGDPETAAQMAFKDASISHVKNGIYGEMFVAAALAAAAVTEDAKEIIRVGLSQIPYTSRFYASICDVLERYDRGESAESVFCHIQSVWKDTDGHCWCHTISNAMIVTAALLYGAGDYGKSICLAVGAGFDTDCNGATVGSIVGMAKGIDGVPQYWRQPIQGKLHTTIFGTGDINLQDCVERTLRHLP